MSHLVEALSALVVFAHAAAIPGTPTFFACCNVIGHTPNIDGFNFV
jgi:hypothetical protein